MTLYSVIGFTMKDMKSMKFNALRKGRLLISLIYLVRIAVCAVATLRKSSLHVLHALHGNLSSFCSLHGGI